MGKSMPKKKGGSLSRKELRKVNKEKDKIKRQEHHTKIHQKKVESSPGSLMKAAALIKSKPLIEKSATKDKKDVTKAHSEGITNSKLAYKDPLIEKEDAEIARLGKLLGLNKGKSKKSISAKLNKEFELYEGIGGGFGDFLNKLDMLTDSIEEEEAEDVGSSSNSREKKHSKKRKMVFADGSDDEDEMQPEEYSGKGHIIDDDEQERSDIDEEMDEDDLYYDSEEEEGDEGDEDEEEDEDGSEAPDLVSDPDVSEGEEQEEWEDMNSGEEDEEEDADGDRDDDNEDEEDDGDEESDNDEEEEEEDQDDDDNDDSEGSGKEEEDEDKQSSSLFTYRPVKGEDIYGRSTETNADTTGSDGPKKYIPPAKRKEMLSKIDEQSDAVRMVRKQLNSLMNKLSDQSKDAIVRSIHTVFTSNSVSVCSLVLKDCIMAACANPTQLMTSLIPIYAAVVAALHFSVGADVGAFIIESLSVSLHQAIAAATSGSAASGENLVSSKLPNNALLLLVYLYNLRVVHHTLIVDIMNELAGVTDADSSSGGGSNRNNAKGPFMELRVELIECLINHCGTSIRSDDPVSLKNVIVVLSKLMKSINENSADGSIPENSRMRFMFEALTDLKNNKSRRIQTDNAEIVKGLRKWLGTIKNSLASGRTGGADLCLRVTLRDLLDADKRGRWWKAGASWTGKDTSGAENEDNSRSKQREANKTPVVNEEEAKLLKLATKMRMNTATRRSIFVVLMSSRDVTDAFERLQRLELKGKQDREIVRVITECCGQEKTYNPFYFELAKVLCLQNRQYKTTFQFAFWDFFKQFDSSSSEEEEQALNSRRVVNFARLLAQMICAFQLPLTTIKTIEMSNLNAKMILFISTFFLALFKENISDEDFQNVVDRVATTKDFALVRDNILFFLRRYLEKIPSGLDPVESKKIQRRKKTTIKTMEAMTVLDVSKGMMDPDEMD